MTYGISDPLVCNLPIRLSILAPPHPIYLHRSQVYPGCTQGVNRVLTGCTQGVNRVIISHMTKLLPSDLNEINVQSMGEDGREVIK
jgi:hypothetical protein